MGNCNSATKKPTKPKPTYLDFRKSSKTGDNQSGQPIPKYFNYVDLLKSFVSHNNKTYQKLKSSKTTKIKNLANTTLTELNYSARRITKYFKNQLPYKDSEPYIDEVFPPNINTIFGRDSDGVSIDPDYIRRKDAEDDFDLDQNAIIWLRPDEIFGAKNYALFEGKIEFDDVRQGSIGNCYLMASLSALTEVPEIIAELFRQHEVQENGCYEVCLKIDGEWNVVILDDYFPCSKRTKKPIFATPKNNELWAMLLEKAWAKVNGGYIFTVAGAAAEVIECLTNFPYEYNRIDKVDEQILWKKIEVASGNDYVMTSSIASSNSTDIGLIDGHMYTLEEGKEVNYKGEKIRLLKLRNPWGEVLFSGNWSENSPLWNDELKVLFNYKETYDDEGEFFISFDDFRKYFSNVDICQIKDRVCLKQSIIPYTSSCKPFLYEIFLQNDGYIDIILFKPYWRFVKDLPTHWTLTQSLFLARFEENQPGNNQIFNILTNNHDFNFANGDFTEFYGNSEGQVDCALNVFLKKGRYFLFATVNYESSNHQSGIKVKHKILNKLNTVLSVYSTEFFLFRELNENECKYKGNSLYVLQKMFKDYYKINKKDVISENKIELASSTNLFNSEYFSIYLKNTSGKDLDFTLSLSNTGLIDLFSLNSKGEAIMSSDDDNKKEFNFEFLEDQEVLFLFSCFDIYEPHGIEYSYSYKKLKKKSNNKINNTDEKSSLNNQLPFFIGCDFPIFKKLDISKISNLNDYKWIYKKADFDYSDILKKIDIQDSAFSYFKARYPKEVSWILTIPRLRDTGEGEDDSDLVVQDKVDLDEGSWYLGEWKPTEENPDQMLMHGRGLCFVDKNIFVGQFRNGQLNGIGFVKYPDGSKLEGLFEKFTPVGEYQITHPDGKVEFHKPYSTKELQIVNDKPVEMKNGRVPDSNNVTEIKDKTFNGSPLKTFKYNKNTRKSHIDNSSFSKNLLESKRNSGDLFKEVSNKDKNDNNIVKLAIINVNVQNEKEKLTNN